VGDLRHARFEPSSRRVLPRSPERGDDSRSGPLFLRPAHFLRFDRSFQTDARAKPARP